MKEKELKLKDVMCGDWVDVRNDASPNTPHIERITPAHLLRDEHWYGIEIVPEILKKNGFKTEDDVHFSIQGQSNTLELLLVEVPFDGYYFDIVRTEKTINKCNQRCYIDRYFASSNYVHQLQHALRLCGIEKDIEL